MTSATPNGSGTIHARPGRATSGTPTRRGFTHRSRCFISPLISVIVKPMSATKLSMGGLPRSAVSAVSRRSSCSTSRRRSWRSCALRAATSLSSPSSKPSRRTLTTSLTRDRRHPPRVVSTARLTTAPAVATEWLIDTCHCDTPWRSARAAAPPVTRSSGAPESRLSTSTSWKENAPRPTPRAFITASFAANRTARAGTGSRRTAARASSPSVKSRWCSDGRRASTSRKRSMSTRSRPTPITSSASARPAH